MLDPLNFWEWALPEGDENADEPVSPLQYRAPEAFEGEDIPF